MLDVQSKALAPDRDCAAADIVIGTNDKDGVAEYLARIISVSYEYTETDDLNV